MSGHTIEFPLRSRSRNLKLSLKPDLFELRMLTQRNGYEFSTHNCQIFMPNALQEGNP